MRVAVPGLALVHAPARAVVLGRHADQPDRAIQLLREPVIGGGLLHHAGAEPVAEQAHVPPLPVVRDLYFEVVGAVGGQAEAFTVAENPTRSRAIEGTLRWLTKVPSGLTSMKFRSCRSPVAPSSARSTATPARPFTG